MEKNILFLFSLLIEAILLWQYASSLFLPSHSPQKRFALLSSLYVLLFLLSLFDQTGLNGFSFFLCNIVFLYTQFRLRLLSASFHSAVFTAIMAVTELAAFGMISRFFPHFLLEEGLGLVCYMIFSKSSFVAIMYLIIHLLKGKKVSPERHDHSELLLLLIPVASVFIMLTFFIIGETSSFIPPVDFLVMISAVFLLLVNLLIFSINQYNQKKAREFTDMQLLLQKESDSAEYYEMLLAQNKNQGILIHDIKKHLQSIQLLNENNAPDKIDAYIRQLMDSSALKETARICDHEMLNAILCRYQRTCHEKQIAFHTDIRSGTVQTISPHDLTALFCNLLDNAAEAAEHIPDAFIELTVQKKEHLPFIVIVVINSCRSAPVYDADGLPVSCKAGSPRHGFGIKSINKAVKQYQGNLKMYYDDASATFHTIITLKCHPSTRTGKAFFPK